LLVPFFGVQAPYNNGLMAPVFAALVWALTVTPTRLSRWLCSTWLVALGNASYALYLIHMPLLSLFLQFHLVTHLFYLLYLALCVGLSLLSFRYFETPARLWLLARFDISPGHMPPNRPPCLFYRNEDANRARTSLIHCMKADAAAGATRTATCPRASKTRQTDTKVQYMSVPRRRILVGWCATGKASSRRASIRARVNPV
jgi:peptidoglycan/LPS O-acetylase OafA/YrhL